MSGSQPNAIGSNPGPLGGGGKVRSVFGRTGDIVAEFGDYVASLVENDSGVAGASVADALDNLLGAVSGLTSDDIANGSGVGGATVTAALNNLLTQLNATRSFAMPFGANFFDATQQGLYAAVNGLATTTAVAGLGPASQIRLGRACSVRAIGYRKQTNPGGTQINLGRNGGTAVTFALSAGANAGVYTPVSPIAYAAGDTISLRYDAVPSTAPGQVNFQIFMESP